MENIILGWLSSEKLVAPKGDNIHPYEAFSFYHGEDVLEKLACRQVPAKDIMLKPNLLKK